jgi:hypothetical protein
MDTIEAEPLKVRKRLDLPNDEPHWPVPDPPDADHRTSIRAQPHDLIHRIRDLISPQVCPSVRPPRPRQPPHELHLVVAEPRAHAEPSPPRRGPGRSRAPRSRDPAPCCSARGGPWTHRRRRGRAAARRSARPAGRGARASSTIGGTRTRRLIALSMRGVLMSWMLLGLTLVLMVSFLLLLLLVISPWRRTSPIYHAFDARCPLQTLL